MLESELTFTVDDDEVVAGPGTFVLVPPGIPHTFANRGDARLEVFARRGSAQADSRPAHY